jgi:A/G-specific adenine glycosylase
MPSVPSARDGAGDTANRLSRRRIEWFRERLLEWAGTHPRTFFWRTEKLDRYELLVVEVLLARTRAEAVEPVARAFLRSYPSVHALARADVADVERILRPLGLFRKRASALVTMANSVVGRFGGIVPERRPDLLQLAYVGRYAANAVHCFEVGRRAAVVDANVIRVLGRFFDLPKPAGKAEHAEEYWQLANRLVPSAWPREYNWALLDLGAAICTARAPKCGECPVSLHCAVGRRRR